MRGQTTLDFVIGIAVFLGVLVFAFSFVPGILQPFELTDDEEPSLSDRIANTLSQERLGSPAEPYVLDRYCTVHFFDESPGAPADCNYEDESLEEMFELRQTHNLNITLKGNVTPTGSGMEQLCWTEEAPPHNESGLVELDDCDENNDDVVLARGEPVAEQGGTITARRVVSLHGESVMVEVVLW